MRLYSVTEVGGRYADFSRVKPDVMERAQERGTIVHRACAAYVSGLFCPPIPDEFQGYVDGFKRWFDKYVTEVLSVEEEFKSAEFGFVGHPDLIAVVRGDRFPAMIDLKTALAPQKLWRMQLAAYRYLALKRFQIERIFSLPLKVDGSKPRPREYTDTYEEDFNAFRSALNVRRWLDAA